MSDTIEGGCQCGAVHYTVTAKPLWGGHCQCTSCQKFSGTGHASNFLVPLDAFEVSGELSEYAYVADSGNNMKRYVCATCASPIYGVGSGNPSVAVVRAGSLADPSTFEPQALIYTDSSLAWDGEESSLPTFPKMPQR
jgi:hypothetical protein